jgi:hypothetical protein
MAAARVRPQEFQLDASKAPVTKKSFWPKAAAQAGALKVRQRLGLFDTCPRATPTTRCARM